MADYKSTSVDLTGESLQWSSPNNYAGTGGSQGVGYLMKALDITFFPELWSGRSRFADLIVAVMDGREWDRVEFRTMAAVT